MKYKGYRVQDMRFYVNDPVAFSFALIFDIDDCRKIENIDDAS